MNLNTDSTHNGQTTLFAHSGTGEPALRTLVVVLGDQLDLDAAAFDGFDAEQDMVWMAEVAEESTHVWSSQQRIVLFLAAMRHFAAALRQAGRRLHYTSIDDTRNKRNLGAQLLADIDGLKPARVVMTAPGEWRVLQDIRSAVTGSGLTLEIREDRHFFVSVREFAAHAKTRRTLRMEPFYREQRKRHRVLMQDQGGHDEPLGGQWNFDANNRQALGPQGPGFLPARTDFAPDPVTEEVIALVRKRFGGHPGQLDHFNWPVTRAQALQSLRTFIEERLPLFGCYQDAMWPDEPWLYHSHLSAALNLKLLNPREVVDAAEQAYHQGLAPLSSVEGFIRQILGWREYVRGIYWTQMPAYIQRNELEATLTLPHWYWSGQTDKACLRDALQQTLTHGYANHIQRLMVTGLYALLLGVQPQQLHAWYLAVYVDAVEWVELPNTLGMSQYADGGLMASKPYIASGKYIERMSPYCRQCRYKPALRSGELACPFTTLYWDFLLRHEHLLSSNPRTALQVKHLQGLSDAERKVIQMQAQNIRKLEADAAAPIASRQEQAR